MSNIERLKNNLLYAINYFIILVILIMCILSPSFKPSVKTYLYNNYKEGMFLGQEIYYKDLVHINNNNHQIYISDVIETVSNIHEMKIRLMCLRNNPEQNYEFYKIKDLSSNTCPICDNKIEDTLIQQIKDLTTKTQSITFKFVNYFSMYKVIVPIIMLIYLFTNMIIIILKTKSKFKYSFEKNIQLGYIFIFTTLYIISIFLISFF